MAWVNPKISWSLGDSPSTTDFNRIEDNTLHLYNTKLNLSGGTMTGNLIMRMDYQFRGIGTNGESTNLAMVDSTDTSIFGSTNRITRLHSKENPQIRVGNTNYWFYHTGNRPSPDDIGALSKNGGTLLGNLTVSKGGTATITITDTAGNTQDKIPTLIFDRPTVSSWLIENRAGYLNIRNNYTGSVVPYFDVIKLHYTTGMVQIPKGDILLENGGLTISKGNISVAQGSIRKGNLVLGRNSGGWDFISQDTGTGKVLRFYDDGKIEFTGGVTVRGNIWADGNLSNNGNISTQGEIFRGQLRIGRNTSNNWEFLGNNGADKWLRFYDDGKIEFNGGLTIRGNTSTDGNFLTTGNGKAGYIQTAGNSRTMVYQSTTAGNHLFGGNNDGGNEIKDYVRVAENKLQYTTQTKSYNIVYSSNVTRVIYGTSTTPPATEPDGTIYFRYV